MSRIKDGGNRNPNEKPRREDFEQDSHGAFGEYETHFNARGYANALEKYMERLEFKNTTGKDKDGKIIK